MDMVLNWLIAQVELRYPASAILIEAVRPYVDADKLAKVIVQAFHDYQAGLDFHTILKDMLTPFMPTLPDSQTPNE